MLQNIIQETSHTICPVITFNPLTHKLLLLDFTETNKELTANIIGDTGKFSHYINSQLHAAIDGTNARLGIGGYNEHRTVYSRSDVFNGSSPDEEPRRLHLGIDIWGDAGTNVFAPLDGMVHSYAFNDQYGDYGATIILSHLIDNFTFHSLYGHLALKDLNGLKEGKKISAGELIAHFGEPKENGHWPPHLHFQLIIDMEGKKGDYPGVCKFSEREKYLANCPDPDILLRMMQHAINN